MSEVSKVTHEGPLPNNQPYYKNGWSGAIIEHHGVPVGTFIIRCRKGSRVFSTPPMTAEQVETFDPDVFWKTP